MTTFHAQMNAAAVRAAYAALGDRVGKNLVKKCLREALIPVRELQRGAWMAADFRTGRNKHGTKMKHSPAMRKRMRARATKPIVVRIAVRRAITIKVDRSSKGIYSAGVGIDYAKRGLHGQQRMAHIIEGGRRRRSLPAREIGRLVNRQQAAPAEQRFLDALMTGIKNGV